LEAEEINGYYVILADYAESGNLRYITDSYDPIGGGLDSSGMEWILSVNLLGDMELAANVWNPMNLSLTSISPEFDEEIENSWIAELLPNIMALVIYLVIIMTASILVTALTDEKKNRILEVLLSSVSSNQLITGKILAAGFLGLLTLFVWISVLWGVITFGGQSLSIPAGFSLPSSLLIWAIVYALLGYAMYGSQMAGLGALVPDIKDSRGLSFVVLAPLIIVYMFLTIIVTRPDGIIAIVLSLFPLTAPVGMITRMAATEVPLWQALLSALLQIITVVIIVRLAARLFHAQTMLSGQPVGIRRFYSAMFGKHNR
jgi:ABC-2 type transport system permease protein